MSHCKMNLCGREESVSGVRMGKSGQLERPQLANQVQGIRILDRSDACEKINFYYTAVSHKGWD